MQVSASRLNRLSFTLKRTASVDSNKEIILIRHAQSEFNLAEQRFADERGIPNNFKQMLKNPQFTKEVIYNIKYMDAPITQFGRKQCQKTREILSNETVDLVLVSPHLRALQTCHQVFKGRKVKVVLEPLLAEIFRYSCDVSSHSEKKKEMFPDYNFERLDKEGLLWFLNVLQEHQKDKYLKGLDKLDSNKHEHKQEQILRLLQKESLYESFQNLRNRMDKVKNIILDHKKQGYNRIAVIAHYHVIQWLLAKQFDSNHQPKPYTNVLNCHPYYRTLQELMKNK